MDNRYDRKVCQVCLKTEDAVNLTSLLDENEGKAEKFKSVSDVVVSCFLYSEALG